MKIKIFLALIMLSLKVYSQSELYIPTELQDAYTNGTRVYDGNVSEYYWQNSANYTIEVKVIPGTWSIVGSEKIVYTNNSPDTLNAIVIKTYPNHYKKGAARASSIPSETLTDGMVISDIVIDESFVSLNDNPNVINYNTYTLIKLIEPTPSGSSITMEVKWITEMPLTYVNRIGAYDENSAFVGYWYPQIGRYDDIDGWDRIEYLASQEFNNDFANFNVKIRVPSGYNVWATGTLQNPDEVLSNKELQQYTKAKKSRDAVVINPGNAKPRIDNREEIWHYSASSIKDFAFGVSNTFKWIGNTVSIDGKDIFSNVVYDINQDASAERLLEVQEKSLIYLSSISPGIIYPYPVFTTFIGVAEYDGMEFPMIANNGMSYSKVKNTVVTFHELAHTYFPFLVGINEVKYSWMEEGWATYFTTKFIQYYYKDTEYENEELIKKLYSYNRRSGRIWDLPLITPSFLLTFKPSHYQLSYNKSAFLYFVLEDMLGEVTFRKCLKSYINRWEGKHPTPYDFIFTFNEVSNENLDWFWNAWIFQLGYGDIELTSLDLNNSKVYIKNIGGLPLPVILKITYKNGRVQIIERTAKIWLEDNISATIRIDNVNNLRSIELVTTLYPDSDKTNNSLEL